MSQKSHTFYPSGLLTRGGRRETFRPLLPPSSPFLSLRAVPLTGTTSTQQGLSQGLSCLKEWFHVNAHLSTANKTQSWSCMRARSAGVGGGRRWTVGSKRGAEDRQRGKLTSHCGDPGHSHQSAQWFQMLYPCCRVTHTFTHNHTSTLPPTGARLPYYLRS